jgi:hypothetical protein
MSRRGAFAPNGRQAASPTARSIASSTDPRVLQSVAAHSTIIASLTGRIRDTLIKASGDDSFPGSARTAELARRWSTHADQLVVEACQRLNWVSEREVRQLLTEADRAADALEEAADRLTLLPDSVHSETLARLVGLADVVLDAVLQYIHCLEDFRDLSSSFTDSNADRVLIDVERLVDLHHQAIEKRRALAERLLHVRGPGPGDFHDLHVVGDMARGFERTSTAIARCGAMVRDHVLRTQPDH